MKKLHIAIIAIIGLTLTSCASVNVPLGKDAKYGTLTVGYLPPANLPYGINTATLKDK